MSFNFFKKNLFLKSAHQNNSKIQKKINLKKKILNFNLKKQVETLYQVPLNRPIYYFSKKNSD
jgi:hypothetical protein